MVSDKYQVRTTGPVHNLTQQPVKGRKRAGGIRFGEMERDSLLAHGVSYLLQDRLMNCSDYSLVSCLVFLFFFFFLSSEIGQRRICFSGRLIFFLSFVTICSAMCVQSVEASHRRFRPIRPTHCRMCGRLSAGPARRLQALTRLRCPTSSDTWPPNS